MASVSLPSGGTSHSVSTSGGGGSSSSGHAASHRGTASASASTEARVARRLYSLGLQGDGSQSSQPSASKKKKKGAQAVGPDKNGRGLRHFSMRTCEKVESKGRTTYNELAPEFDFHAWSFFSVADELVAEFSDPNNIDYLDPNNPNAQPYDEKNIRRRVYDALNVLMALEIISKDNKEILWKGFPRNSMNEAEELKTEIMGMKGQIDKKNIYLKDLQARYVSLQTLIQRNEQLYGSGDDAPSGGVALPFILVQTHPHATVEVEISEDMQLVHFDFSSGMSTNVTYMRAIWYDGLQQSTDAEYGYVKRSTPFELQDDSFILEEMGLSDKKATEVPVANGGEVEVECSITPTDCCYQSQQPARPSPLRLPPSAPIPGILKARVKQEH